MSRPGFFAVILTLLILTETTTLLAADVPDIPYVEVSFATEGPLSLFCAPNGGGFPFTQAFDQAGNQVDGTLTIILYDNPPPWGEPVPNYPFEDLWLVDLNDDLAACNNGTICSVNTDADGMTYWSGPLYAGGRAEPIGGNQVAICLNGLIIESPSLSDFRINSSDLNGDLSVDLFDLSIFSNLYFGPYAYEGDFHWDGVLNLADVAEFARTFNTECP